MIESSSMKEMEKEKSNKTQVFKPYSLFCEMGNTTATVMVPVEWDLQGRVQGFIDKPCLGCSAWSEKKISTIESEIRADALEQFGSDDEHFTGITPGCKNKLYPILLTSRSIKSEKTGPYMFSCSSVKCPEDYF